MLFLFRQKPRVLSAGFFDREILQGLGRYDIVGCK